MRFLAAVLATLLIACAPSTPDTRIEANRADYDSLSERQQNLVRQGRIEEGMPPQAVFLAWGRPSRDYIGQEGKAHTRIWEYAGSRPVYSTHFYGGYGYGYGRYGRYGRGGPYCGYSVAPQVTYIPYRKASVWFRNDRVSKWERVR